VQGSSICPGHKRIPEANLKGQFVTRYTKVMLLAALVCLVACAACIRARVVSGDKAFDDSAAVFAASALTCFLMRKKDG
jgi:hypothetical protein